MLNVEDECICGTRSDTQMVVALSMVMLWPQRSKPQGRDDGVGSVHESAVALGEAPKNCSGERIGMDMIKHDWSEKLAPTQTWSVRDLR